MGAILLNSLGLFVIILIGYLTKRLNLLMKADGSMISKIVVNVTLPAAIIVNLQYLAVKNQLLLLIVAGLVLNLVMILIGHFLSRKQEQVEREFLMYGVSGYNIGNFAIPFVQSFIPQAIPILSFFDIGNSVMLAGGSNVVIEGISGSDEERPSVKKVLGRLFRSVPFLCYLIMLSLRILELDLPEAVFQIAQPIADANTFLSMFMDRLVFGTSFAEKGFSISWTCVSNQIWCGPIAGGFFYAVTVSGNDQNCFMSCFSRTDSDIWRDQQCSCRNACRSGGVHFFA